MIDRVESGGREVLDDALAPWLEKYPDVPVRHVVSREYPTNAVLGEADGAQLIGVKAVATVVSPVSSSVR